MTTNNTFPKIRLIFKRYKELGKITLSPDSYYHKNYKLIVYEHQLLSKLVAKYKNLERIKLEIFNNYELSKDSNSHLEIITIANEEIKFLEVKYSKILNEILVEMIPVGDSFDNNNIIVEIRAGTGGNEASLFAVNMYRMYCKFAENLGWRIEVISINNSECGGLREIIFGVNGSNVYGVMKYESGVHRVQRIPVTETNSRVHTSTTTVAVLPEARDIDISINPDEIEITVCRASGPGGQGVNTTDSAVQIIHKPTGITVNCSDERSQQKNKQKAMKVLRSRLLQKEQAIEHAKYAANRKCQVGKGIRSERIRTYNFPQSRLTDHRINFTLRNLNDIMNGQLMFLIKKLQDNDHEKLMNVLFGD